MGSPPVKGFGQGSAALAAWAESVYRPEDEVLREIRARTAAAGLPSIEVGRFDGLHLEVLARACGARKAIEIGALGGYSGVCLLRGMGEGGFLHTFERDPRHAAVARESFRRAAVAGRVELHVGDAAQKLRDVEGQGPFDLVFIDAEEHLRVGGVVLADNTFGFGHIHEAPPAGEEDAVAALRRFSERLAGGGRFRATMLPTEEGLSLGVKVR